MLHAGRVMPPPPPGNFDALEAVHFVSGAPKGVEIKLHVIAIHVHVYT